MLNKTNKIVPGTLFIDAVPVVESDRIVSYMMTVYSSDISDTSHPVRLIVTSISYSNDWVKYDVSDNDCSLSFNMNGKVFNNIKLCPGMKEINFRSNSDTNIQFQSNGYYVISVYDNGEVTLLPLSTLSDVKHIDKCYIFPQDIAISDAQHSFKELCDIVTNIVDEISTYVKLTDSNIEIEGDYIGHNFVAGNINLLDVSKSLKGLVSNFSQHLEDYSQLSNLVNMIRTAVTEISAQLKNFVTKNDDGSIIVKNVIIPIDGDDISILDICNMVSASVIQLNNLLQEFNVVQLDYAQTKDDVAELINYVNLNTNDISTLAAKIENLSEVVSQLQTIQTIDFDKFVQYDASGSISTNDLKFDATGLTLVYGQQSDSNGNCTPLQHQYDTNSTLFQILNDVCNLVSEHEGIFLNIDLSELNNNINEITRISTSVDSIHQSISELNAHVANMKIHISQTEKGFIQQLMNPELVYVVVDE